MIHVGVQRVIAVAAARADMMQEAVLNDDGIFFLAARRVVEWSGDGCEHTRSAGTTPNTRVYCLMIHTKESERVRDTREDREHQIQANPCGTHFPSGKKKIRGKCAATSGCVQLTSSWVAVRTPCKFAVNCLCAAVTAATRCRSTLVVVYAPCSCHSSTFLILVCS